MREERQRKSRGKRQHRKREKEGRRVGRKEKYNEKPSTKAAQVENNKKRGRKKIKAYDVTR